MSVTNKYIERLYCNATTWIDDKRVNKKSLQILGIESHRLIKRIEKVSTLLKFSYLNQRRLDSNVLIKMVEASEGITC